jgi:hypothetical protein
MKSYFIKYSMNARDFIFSFFLNASFSFKNENVLQSKTLKWTISFRIDFFSNFCMKINDEFQFKIYNDVWFNMCAATR